MKKSIIKITSVLLVFVMSVIALTSCKLVQYGNHIFPEGYSGGVGLQPGAKVEYWWVETYEECIDAIELLKSHGSTFKTEYVFACDEDLFDVKYCFVIIGDGKSGEKIKFGDNPFDRWAYDVEIAAMAFFDDVTIDELVYSLVKYYEAYQIDLNSEAYRQVNDSVFELDDLTIGDWTPRVEDMTSGTSQYYLNLSREKQPVFTITTSFYYPYEESTTEFKLNDECIEYIINTCKVIDLSEE